MKRVCLDCKISIEDRHPTTKYCFNCAKKRNVQAAEKRKKKLEEAKNQKRYKNENEIKQNEI